MIATLVIVGVALQAIAWRVVVLRRAPFWPVVAGTWTVLGTGALLIGDPRCCGDRGPTEMVLVGIAAGLALYGATRLVVTFASRWPVLAEDVEATYGRSAEAPPALVWIVTLAVAAPGEELFWRGVATPWLVDATAPLPGGVLAWLMSVGVAAAWASPTFLAGAAVGGAVWTALAIWSGGVAAPLASHVIWTACMVAWRPPTARAKVAA